jgi:TfoX/Sxy family transcriptional regulator of competence genes
MYDEGLLERCLDCLAAMSVPHVRHKNVFGMRGLMCGKQMFAAVGESSIIAKMPKHELAAALKQPGITRFTPGGQSLGTWVEIQEDVIADDPQLRDWLAAGLRGIG